VLWLFWDVELEQLDTEKHADYILARVLERGRLEDVRWALQSYGRERIRDFFRSRSHAEISARTLAFWRAFLREEQAWPTPPAFRQSSSEPWHG
jgi:hypothetical protein